MIIFRQKPKSTQKFTIMFTIVSLLKKKVAIQQNKHARKFVKPIKSIYDYK